MDVPKIVVLAIAGLAVVDCGTTSAEPRSFRCQHQTLPEFTLGEKSNPTGEQVEQLCQCIWEKLGTWEKTVATSLSGGKRPKEPLPSPDQNELRTFITRFNEALTQCGGYDL